MGCCQSDTKSKKESTKGKQSLTPKAPNFYICPNAWCHQRIAVEGWTEHKQGCDKMRKSRCFKCGLEFALSDFDNHLKSCHPAECERCGSVVIKRLLNPQYCPGSYESSLKRRSPPTTELDAVQRLQKFVRGIRVTREWCALIFRIIWLKMDKYDERGLFKSTTNNLLVPDGPAKRMSILVQDTKQTMNGDDLLQYPDEGLSYLPYDEKVDHIKSLRELIAHKRLPITYVKKLLTISRYKLSEIPNVQVVTPVDGTVCVVIGDLHGQLQDFNRIIDDRGLPSEKLIYIFNGDLVDRGCNSCEVLCCVLAMFLAFPGCVFLNRGNHESQACTDHYGCHQEVLAKYSESVYKLMLEVFNSLPLCALVDSAYLIVHGGLPRYDILIDEINSINRFQEIPSQPKNKQEQIFLDLLWSDPDLEPYEEGMPDYEHNATRDAGCKWRLPLTKRFTKNNKLSLVIRAHHVPHAGYERLHDDLITTVFSASNYSGIDANHGAVAIMMMRNSKMSIIYDTWKVYEPLSNSLLPPLPVSPSGPNLLSPSYNTPSNDSSALARTLTKWVSAEKDVLRQLREKIFQNRHMLMASFCETDTTDRGTVWKSEWRDILSSLVGVEDLPWFFMRRYLAAANPDTQRIPFAKFLRRYDIPFLQQRFHEWLPHLVKWLGSQNKNKLSTLFDDMCTKDHLYYTEFFELVTNKLGTLLNKDIVFMLYSAMDPDSTGYCSKDKWLELFERHHDVGYMTCVKNWTGMVWEIDTKQHIMWDLWLMQRFKKYLRRMSHNSAFRLLDREKRGTISVDDLRAVIAKMSLSGEGHMNAQNKNLYGLAKDFRKQVVYRLGAHESEMYVARLFGIDEEAVKKSMKRRGDRSVEIQIWPLSKSQLEAFHSRLDYDADGEITFIDFQMSFCVQDSESTTAPHRDSTTATNITWNKAFRQPSLD